MTQTVLIFAAHGDLEAATQLADAIHADEGMSAILCAVSPGKGRLRLGETVTAVAAWSARAQSDEIAEQLHAVISQHPTSSVFWRLDDTPWPSTHPLERDVMTIGPGAQGADTRAVANAVRLAGRRAETRVADAPAPARAETPAWPAIALGVLITGALATAGYSAWRDAPERPRLTVAPPFAQPTPASTPEADATTPPDDTATDARVDETVETTAPARHGASTPMVSMSTTDPAAQGLRGRDAATDAARSAATANSPSPIAGSDATTTEHRTSTRPHAPSPDFAPQPSPTQPQDQSSTSPSPEP